MLHVGGGGLEAAAVAGELAGVDVQEAPGLQGQAGGGQGVHHHRREVREGGVEGIFREEKVRALARHVSGLHQGVRVLAELEEGGLGPLVDAPALAEEDQGGGVQVVKGSGELGVDQGEVAVQAAGQDPAPELLGIRQDGLHDLLRPLAAAEALGLGLHGVGQAGKPPLCQVGQDLGAGEDQGLGDVLDPALRAGVEEAHGVDLIPEELAADGLFHEGGEDIQDAAPDGELAHALHLLAAGIARRRQGFGEGGEVQDLLGL